MKKKVLPLKPEGAVVQKLKDIPPEVIEAFNELIAENLRGGYATVLQKDVVARIVAKGIKKDAIYANNWLDVEGIYEKNGWTVWYDKPGYCESYEPSFEFSAKR